MHKDKRYLNRCITTTVKTVGVGAIQAIEEEFGELWGFGSEEKTKEEQEIEAKWMVLRNRILQRVEDSIDIALDNVAPLNVKRVFYYHKF